MMSDPLQLNSMCAPGCARDRWHDGACSETPDPDPMREALHTAECLLDDCAQVWEGAMMPSEKRIKGVLADIAKVLRPTSATIPEDK